MEQSSENENSEGNNESGNENNVEYKDLVLNSFENVSKDQSFNEIEEEGPIEEDADEEVAVKEEEFDLEDRMSKREEKTKDDRKHTKENLSGSHSDLFPEMISIKALERQKQSRIKTIQPKLLHIPKLQTKEVSAIDYKKEVIFDQKKPLPVRDNKHSKTAPLMAPIQKFHFSNYISQVGCSSIYFGFTPIKQESFSCSECLISNKPVKICKYCHFNCHVNCTAKSNDAKYEPIGETFYCYCGIHMKHYPQSRKEKKLIPCKMMHLDQHLELNEFFCVTDKKNICRLCSVLCHQECSLRPKAFFSPEEEKKCQCTSKRHQKSYDEFIFNFPIEEFIAVSGLHILPIQIVNIFFKIEDIFSNDKKMIINSNMLENPYSLYNNTEFAMLIELFANTLNTNIKTFYYNEEMMEMLRYDSLFHIIMEITYFLTKTNSKKFSRHYLTVFRLLFFVLFIHLKKDFQLSKSLTSIDFLSNSIIDRLMYKTTSKKQSIFNEHLCAKYNLLNGFPFKAFLIGSLKKLLVNGIESLSILKNPSEFEIVLKLLCFMTKHFMFNKEELIQLISSLYHFHCQLFHFLLKNKNSVYPLLDIFNALIELSFMIGVSYNDLIIEDFIKEGKPLKRFIHRESGEGRKLLMIVIKNCNLLQSHYMLLPKRSDISAAQLKDKLSKLHQLEMYKRTLNKGGRCSKAPKNGGLLSEKRLMLLNESLELFCLADNNYQKQIDKITQEDLNDYHLYCTALKRKDFFHLVAMSEKKDDSNIFYHLKVSIETLLYEIFAMVSLEKRNFLSQEITKRLLNTIDLFTANFSSIKVKPKQLKDIHITPFTEKILHRISGDIEFVLLDSFKLHLTQFSQNLIFSQVDDSLFKLLSFFSERVYPNLLTKDAIELIYSFLSLFCLTRQGFQYLLTGKNLSRLQKMISRYSYKPNEKNVNFSLGRVKESNIQICFSSLEFLSLIAKCIDHFHLSIQKHKTLLKLKRTLIVHLEEFNEGDMTLVNSDYVKHLGLILKVFLFLSPSFHYEAYESIKVSMANIMFNSQLTLFTSEKFYQLFKTEDIDHIQISHNKHDKMETAATHSAVPSNPLTEMNEAKTLLTKNEDLMMPSNFTTLPNTPDEYRLNKKRDKELFFNFFKLMTKDTFYIFKDNPQWLEVLERIDRFNCLDDYKELLAANRLNLGQRFVLFKFLKTFYFIDYLDPFDIKKQGYCLTNKEMVKLIVAKAISDEKAFNTGDDPSSNEADSIPEEKASAQAKKYFHINKLISLILLYTHEWEVFPLQFEGKTSKNVNDFLLELLQGTKLIGDHIIQHINISNKVLPFFYKLTLEFLSKHSSILLLHGLIKDDQSFMNLARIDIENDSPVMKEMKKIAFDIFNKEEIYKHLLEAFNDIYLQTKINEGFALKAYLETYDNMVEANFTPFSLLQTKDYEYFYEEEAVEAGPSPKQNQAEKLKEAISRQYIKEFGSITKTNFFSVGTSESSEFVRFDYQKQLIDYFFNFINSTEAIHLTQLQGILCIMTKFLLYDTSTMQLKMLHIKQDAYFFNNINQLLNNYIVLVISSMKRHELFDLSLLFMNTSKLILHLLQLLGEDFNLAYHFNIFHVLQGNAKEADQLTQSSSEPEDEETFARNEEMIKVYAEKAITRIAKRKKTLISLLEPFTSPLTVTLYESIINNAVHSYYLMNLHLKVEAELPNDKLCILISNLIDFIIEYIASFGPNEAIINEKMRFLFFNKATGVLPLFKLKLDEDEYRLRNKILCYLKIKYCQLLIAYLQTGNKKAFAVLLSTKGFSSIELFGEILSYFRILLGDKLSTLKKNKDRVEWLYTYYVFNPEFREAIEIKVCFKLYILIRIYEEFYNDRVLRIHFESLPKEAFTDADYRSIQSSFAYDIYYFLEMMIIKVEVKTKTVHTSMNAFVSYEKLANQMTAIKKGRKPFGQCTDSSSSLTQPTFFLKPYLTFFLSAQSRKTFEKEVNRTNAAAKFVDLVLYTDIFAFEMINNMHIINYSFFVNALANINFFYLELSSFMMVCIQNCLILYFFFISLDLPPEDYDVRDTNIGSLMFIGNYILSFIQISFVAVIVLLWFRFKFIISLQRNVMLKYKQNFIFHKSDKEKENIRQQEIVNYFQANQSASLFKVLRIINREVGSLRLFLSIVFDTILFNREICFLVFTVILNIMYQLIGNSILLAIPLLFSANLSPTLADIVKTIQMKIFNVFLVLLFMVAICYIYSWFSIYYMRALFAYDKILETQSGLKVNEAFCSSTVQCMLFIIQQGIRAGGGIGDIKPKLSFQSNAGFFVLNFFYDMIYHILVIWILNNVLTGLIVDTFAELRDLNRVNDYDAENVCFICQLTRDDCIRQNVDFDKHRKKEHNVWFYVDFLMHLHLGNSNDFNRVENLVWEKVKEQDFGWIPISSHCNDDV